jgi:hypothetical protein
VSKNAEGDAECICLAALVRAGAIVAAAVLYAIASGKPDWVAGGFASNGFGDLSPGKYGKPQPRNAEHKIIEYLYRHRYDLPPEVWIELERRHLGP